jgi:hypothetical protein
MATGGLVLMLDRMGSDEGDQVVRGIAQEVVDRLDEMGATTYPPREVWGSADQEAVSKWRHIGAVGPQSRRVRYSPTVDPEYLKILGARMLEDAGVRCLFHAWASSAIVSDGAVEGVIFESKSGRLAVLAEVVVDCTGDGDVFASAGRSSRGRTSRWPWSSGWAEWTSRGPTASSTRTQRSSTPW